MEALEIDSAVVTGPLHNNPNKPDPKGVHWTVTLLNWAGQLVTVKHIYPSKAELEKVKELSKIIAEMESKQKKKDKQDKKDKEKKDKEKKDKEKKDKEKKEKEKKKRRDI
ncbi:hypothetical protein E4U30_008212 [Claviceps sp. LM220 group G6]|nr:hypothetical protein E4U30_008212 [Claviceps sp. LM220 group G6]